LKAINDATSGVVTISNEIAISGTVSDTKAGLVGVTGATATVTLSDASATAITAADLKAINDATSGTVTISNAVAISGTVANAKAGLAGVTGATATVTLSDAGSSTDIDPILAATTGAVTTAALQAGTYANFATGDKLVLKATAFGSGVSSASPTLPAASNGVLDWIFNTSNNTLTYETADNGTTATTVELVLTGIASVSETTGTIELTHS
jgi:hypothetical protein